MNLLHVDSSILGEGSVSRQLSADIVAAEQRRQPGLSVTYRDLAVAPVGHLSGAHLAAFQGAAPETPELARDLAAGQAALEEFLAADIIVVGAPMYNFSVPSQLKAWIDRLAVAGKTFRYSENGPVGLAGGKKVIVASSRGGFYGPGTPVEVARPSGKLFARRVRLLRHHRRQLHPGRGRGARRGAARQGDRNRPGRNRPPRRLRVFSARDKSRARNPSRQLCGAFAPDQRSHLWALVRILPNASKPPRKITRRGAPAIRRGPCGAGRARRADLPRAFP